MAVRVDLMISLDGFATTTDQTPEKPFGDDWGRLTQAYVATRTFRQRVFHDTTGAGTTGRDEDYARQYFENIGAEVMGAGMFGFHAHPSDPDWSGWWGDTPPFRCPVFVLTHRPRPSLTLSDTTFHFLDTGIEDALARATEAAGGRDVRIGGGPSLVRDYLRADLVDHLHVWQVPIILGSGIRLWDGLRGIESHFSGVKSETSESGTIHITFTR
jgi:dihydrofolate reductase